MDAWILGVQWLPLILPPTPTLNALAFFSIDTSVSRISSYKEFSDHSLPQYSLGNFIFSLAQLLWWVPRSWILISLRMWHLLPSQFVWSLRAERCLLSSLFPFRYVVCCCVCRHVEYTGWVGGKTAVGFQTCERANKGERRKTNQELAVLL